ncbi:MAG: Mut7-C RNAse domain-containing protein [Thermoplasmata archaeon]
MADEMLGRLARYLRFMGFDTAYARGLPDDEVRARAELEGRVLLTRDHALAHHTPGAVGLLATDIDGQLAELRRAFPTIRWEIRFERCTLCNGPLGRWTPSPGGPLPRGAPRELVEQGLALYRCSDCGHVYWEGSHSEHVRSRIARATAASEV